jgi:hypothetical protein
MKSDYDGNPHFILKVPLLLFFLSALGCLDFGEPR